MAVFPSQDLIRIGWSEGRNENCFSYRLMDLQSPIVTWGHHKKKYLAWTLDTSLMIPSPFPIEVKSFLCYLSPSKDGTRDRVFSYPLFEGKFGFLDFLGITHDNSGHGRQHSATLPTYLNPSFLGKVREMVTSTTKQLREVSDPILRKLLECCSGPPHPVFASISLPFSVLVGPPLSRFIQNNQHVATYVTTGITTTTTTTTTVTTTTAVSTTTTTSTKTTLLAGEMGIERSHERKGVDNISLEKFLVLLLLPEISDAKKRILVRQLVHVKSETSLEDDNRGGGVGNEIGGEDGKVREGGKISNATTGETLEKRKILGWIKAQTIQRDPIEIVVTTADDPDKILLSCCCPNSVWNYLFHASLSSRLDHIIHLFGNQLDVNVSILGRSSFSISGF
eukprot:TRINITY_DN9512_c0_g2_i4.p1 TRINITY_DN9512_c0_g2~~TRINITY_DN9512_c0_g2_i4.p1  ORF type:complete len:394 (-),score=94.35 TRINITY_DN9512_c0_g2_i4:368-1549(-)